MDNFYLLLTLLPLAGINIWHGILLAQRSRDGKPHTISEHAAETPRLLLIHRLVHTISPAIFLLFGFGYLLPHGHTLAFAFLAVGVTLDAIEVMTLSKGGPKGPFTLSVHHVTAWLMALSYLSYAIIISSTSNMSPWISNSIWVSFVLLLTLSAHRKFRHFWIEQMLYFTFVCLIAAIAHVRLLSW